MKKSRISTLKELREEKARLRLMSKVTKREMSHSVGLMRSETKDFALKKVAVPAGIVAALGLVVNKITSSSQNEQRNMGAASSGNGNVTKVLMALLPFALKFFSKQQEIHEDIKENIDEQPVVNVSGQAVFTD